VVDRSDIAQIVRQLDHPDVPTRREALDQLVAFGSDAVDALVASLKVAETSRREGIVRALGRIGDADALLPLMRYVFDTQGEPAESDARGLAMQAIMKIAGPQSADRLFEFLVDMRDDDDPFVRGYVIEAFGRLDDARAKPFVKEARDDSAEFVRECADRAWAALEHADSDSLRSTLSGRELLEEIRETSGAELDYYTEELLRRDDAFDLALQLVREHGRATSRGLQLLRRIDDDRVRDVARRQFDGLSTDTERALCLRLLADHLTGETTPEERQLIERALRAQDTFVKQAAQEAAASSGDRSLIRRVLRQISTSEDDAADRVARALSNNLPQDQTAVIPDLLDALDQIHRHRLGSPTADLVRTEAYLIRALGRVVNSTTMGARDVRKAVLESMEAAGDHRPILVSSLQTLQGTLPSDAAPLGPDEQFDGPVVAPLLELLDHDDDAISSRALRLTDALVSPDTAGLANRLAPLIYADAAQLFDSVIPLLARIGDERANELLAELTKHDNSDVSEAAEDARG
jgi:HEAT repeat protein